MFEFWSTPKMNEKHILVLYEQSQVCSKQYPWELSCLEQDIPGCKESGRRRCCCCQAYLTIHPTS